VEEGAIRLRSVHRLLSYINPSSPLEEEEEEEEETWLCRQEQGRNTSTWLSTITVGPSTQNRCTPDQKQQRPSRFTSKVATEDMVQMKLREVTTDDHEKYGYEGPISNQLAKRSIGVLTNTARTPSIPLG